MEKSVFKVAKQLADAHRSEDPETREIFLSEASDEVRLVEVSGSVGGSAREVMPFRFAPQPQDGIDFPSVVVLLSPDEWQAVRRGEMKLPPGWDPATLKSL